MTTQIKKASNDYKKYSKYFNLQKDGNKLKKTPLRSVQNPPDVETVVSNWDHFCPSLRGFAFCSVDMRNVCSSCTSCKHWHFIYNIVLCWSVTIEEGGEKSMYSHIQNSHTTQIFNSTESRNRNKEEREGMQKAPVIFNQYSKIRAESSVLKGELPLLYPVHFSLKLPLCLEMLLEWNMLTCRIDTPILYLGK